jgi:hypothetical protein
MDPKTIVAAGLAVLVAAAGGGAALTGAAQPSDDAADVADGPRDVDVTAAHDDGTVTVTVTDAGGGVENVSVHHDDARVGRTDANGTVTFTTDASEELELELQKGAFEGELEYDLGNGPLTLVEESYEYGELGDDEDDEQREDEDEAEDDEDDEGAVSADEASEDDEEDEDE